MADHRPGVHELWRLSYAHNRSLNNGVALAITNHCTVGIPLMIAQVSKIIRTNN